jgi:hypothetical protein
MHDASVVTARRRVIDVADFFAVANDSDSIGRSILRETVARDDRNYGHHHKNDFAHYTLLPITSQNIPTLYPCRRIPLSPSSERKHEIPATFRRGE